jgi:AraC family transcriptional regulator
MSDNPPPEQHLHLVDSFAYGWHKLNLVCEREPRGEMPAGSLPGHMLVIVRGDFCSSIYHDGIWHPINYRAGDIAIVPSSELFPRTWIDREVMLLELFLEPRVLDAARCLELTPQWQIRDPLIEQMGVALQQEITIAGAASGEYADAIAIALSAHLARRYGKQSIASPAGKLTPQQVREVRDYIRANLMADSSVDRLAGLLQLSPGHFATLFKRQAGITPHQYVMRERIDRACWLLRHTDLPIQAIAHQIGLHTQSHFTRLFRQQMGVTPKQYRNHMTS